MGITFYSKDEDEHTFEGGQQTIFYILLERKEIDWDFLKIIKMGRIFIPMFTSTTPGQCQSRQVRPRFCTRPPTRAYQLPLLDTLMSGILGQLQQETMTGRRHPTPDRPTMTGRRHPTPDRQPRMPWVHGVNMRGFQPDEISVKVDNHVVHIAAKHVDETDTGSDVFERHRNVSLPENVDAEKLTCFFAENGKLILKAPFTDKIDNTCPCSSSTRNMDCCKLVPETKSNVVNGDNVCDKRPLDTDVIAVQKPNEQDKSNTGLDEQTPQKTKPSFDTELMNVSNAPDETTRDDAVTLEKEGVKTECDSTSNDAKDITDTRSSQDQQSDLQHELSDATSLNVEFCIEDPTSPQNSPGQSLDFFILEKEEEAPIEDVDHEDQNTTVNVNNPDCLLDIKDMDKSDHKLPLMDSTRITEETDGNKQFEVNVNLGEFTPENTSIRWTNDTLQIEAEKEVNTDSLSAYQKVHREYTLPSGALIGQAVAAMNDEGLLRVTVPLRNDS